MPWLYNSPAQPPCSNSFTTPMLSGTYRRDRRDAFHSPASVMLTNVGTNGLPLNGNRIVTRASFCQFPDLLRRSLTRPLSGQFGPVLQRNIRSRQNLNVPSATLDNGFRNVFVNRSDHSLLHPTIPKRRRTSTGLSDLTLCPMCEVSDPGSHTSATIPYSFTESALHLQVPTPSVVPAIHLIHPTWRGDIHTPFPSGFHQIPIPTASRPPGVSPCADSNSFTPRSAHCNCEPPISLWKQRRRQPRSQHSISRTSSAQRNYSDVDRVEAPSLACDSLSACHTVPDQQTNIADPPSVSGHSFHSETATVGREESSCTQTEDATVVAAAAVASAAARAVAAAAQAVSAVVVHHRQSADYSQQVNCQGSQFAIVTNSSAPMETSLTLRCNPSPPISISESVVQEGFSSPSFPTRLSPVISVDRGAVLSDPCDSSSTHSSLPTRCATSTSKSHHNCDQTVSIPPHLGMSGSVHSLDRAHPGVTSFSTSQEVDSTRISQHIRASIMHLDGSLGTIPSTLNAFSAPVCLESSSLCSTLSSTMNPPRINHLSCDPSSVLNSNFSPHQVLPASPAHGLNGAMFAIPTATTGLYRMATLSQSPHAGLVTLPSEVAAALNAAAISQCSPSAFQLAHSVCSPDVIMSVPQQSSSSHYFINPGLCVAHPLNPAAILPIQANHSLSSASRLPTLSTTRDIQTLFQFLRLLNQRQDPYSLPYYPSAMTATAGVSNVSVVVSASSGGAAGTRVASAVTPPLASHHAVTSHTFNGTTLLPAASSPDLFCRTQNLQPTPSSPQPTSSTTVALAAVAMAAAAALQQQSSDQAPTNVVSGLSSPSPAPTPSIPVPILHAHLYYPTTLGAVQPSPANYVPPCYHLHHAATPETLHHSPISPHVPVNNSFSSTSIASPAYLTHLFPFLLAVPSTSYHPNMVHSIPFSLNHATSLSVNQTSAATVAATAAAAAAAVAAAAAAAAASVDTLYQLAFQLESGTNRSRGLSREELDALYTRPYRCDANSDSTVPAGIGRPELVAAADERCMICLENYNSKDFLRTLRCRHEFHVTCVDKWLKTKRTCPLCRADAFDGTQKKEDSF